MRGKLRCETLIGENTRFHIFKRKNGEKDMSIKKIAESVGASPATVSRVLNNPEYRCKQPELRDRIWKKAIELNYTPNVAARNLKLGVNEENTSTTSVHLLVTSRDNKRMDPFFGESLRVIETEIHRCGCILSNLFFHPAFADANRYDAENPDRIIKDMTGEAESGADGLIMEMHPNPAKALSDGPQSLTPENYNDLMDSVTKLAKFMKESGIKTQDL